MTQLEETENSEFIRNQNSVVREVIAQQRRLIGDLEKVNSALREECTGLRNQRSTQGFILCFLIPVAGIVGMIVGYGLRG